ncbi:MAG: peroxide stress protein YaaA [Arthrobacter sp.]|uniref:YaaA family protein n=1 Tax=Arthrobacter sp. TaxID=1667 RepID=UPI0034989864
MLILLPPSEGKHAAAAGEPFVLEELSFPELAPDREHVLDALATASARPDAHAVLGVGESLAGDVARNRRLRLQPAVAAHSVYTGVLYEALGYASMTPTQRRKADDAVVVVSALWGAVGFADRIPAYRLSMSVALPETGRLAAWWRPRLDAHLGPRAAGHLVIDCRSSTYAAAWHPDPGQAVAVNVFQRRGGRLKVVSHFAKHTRGELARHLLTRRGHPPTSPEALLRAARERWEAELLPGTPRKAHQLNIVLPEDHA